MLIIWSHFVSSVTQNDTKKQAKKVLLGCFEQSTDCRGKPYLKLWVTGVYYPRDPNLFIREDPCGAEREGVGVTSRQQREDDSDEQEQED